MANSFTPQEIEQFLQQFFDVVGARQYVGARYVPIFGRAGEDTVEWDDLAPYEPLTVVMHDGVSYVSRRYVPAGIEISDTAYWVETYRFNAQVEQYRQEVLGFQDEIDARVPFPDPLYYPQYGVLGQVLTTLADGTTKWENPVVPSDEQAEEVITAWLDDHPEATTTVQDGAVTTPKIADGAVTDAKLAQSGGVLKDVSGLKNTLNYNTDIALIELSDGFIENTGSTIDVNTVVESTSTMYAVVECSYGDSFIINGTGGSGIRKTLWAFCKENGDTLTKSAAYTTESNTMIIAPHDAHYLILDIENTSVETNCFKYTNALKKRADSVYLSFFGGSEFLQWENGTFTSAGAESASTTMLRSKKSYLDTNTLYDFSINEGYLFSIWGWDKNDVFKGKFNGTTFSTGSATWFSGETIFENLIDFDYYIRLLIKKENSSAISVSDANNLSITALGFREEARQEFDEIQQALGEYIPSYWVTALETAEAKINLAMCSNDNKICSFIFATDIHAPQYSYQKMPILARHIINNTSVRNVVLGGDIMQSAQSTAEALSNLRVTAKPIMERTDRVFAIAGNHDTIKAFNTVYMQPLETVINTGNVDYYYLDNESQKMRYIFLDSTNPDSGTTGFSSQLSWLVDKIEELDSSWNVIIFTHSIWKAEDASIPTLTITVDGQAVIDALDNNYSNFNAKVIAVVSGHCHRDYNDTTTNGILLIATTCDANGYMASFDPDNSTRTQGTTTEQAFDVFVVDTVAKTVNAFRIGAGNDRTFSYS